MYATKSLKVLHFQEACLAMSIFYNLAFTGSTSSLYTQYQGQLEHLQFLLTPFEIIFPSLLFTYTGFLFICANIPADPNYPSKEFVFLILEILVAAERVFLFPLCLKHTRLSQQDSFSV